MTLCCLPALITVTVVFTGPNKSEIFVNLKNNINDINGVTNAITSFTLDFVRILVANMIKSKKNKTIIPVPEAVRNMLIQAINNNQKFGFLLKKKLKKTHKQSKKAHVLGIKKIPGVLAASPN